jgi:hypothetical protein
MPEIQLSPGTIHYREQRSGPPILMVHGVLLATEAYDEVCSPLRRISAS